MKILLDLDGVMVPVKNWKPAELDLDHFFVFSEQAVSTLRPFIAPETQIVLTTSHKSKYNASLWKAIFHRRGIPVNKISKLNRRKHSKHSRKDEIMEYLNKHDIHDGILILDDDRSLNDLPANYKQYLVQTNSMIGLNEEHRPLMESIIQAYSVKRARSEPAIAATATKPAKALRGARDGSRRSSR